MKFLRVLTRLLACWFVFAAQPVLAEGRAVATYLKPQNDVDVAIARELQSAKDVSAVLTVINNNFYLEDDLEFVFGAEDGPLYDPNLDQIWIPYSFLEEVKERFIQAKYSDSGVSADDATLDALLHTLFHELAHALIFRFELPVVGKEEDAADALATVLLIRFFDDGQEIAISAADLFDLESEESEEELTNESFWGEHSLDSQRFYSTLCHVYGSAPDRYKDLLQESGFSEDRSESCIEEYEVLLDNWLRLLEPHMKKKG